MTNDRSPVSLNCPLPKQTPDYELEASTFITLQPSHQSTMRLMQSDTLLHVKRERAFEMDWIITGSSDEKNLL